MTLESAIQAAIDRARERCGGCKAEDYTNPRAVLLAKAGLHAKHTCHGDLEVLKDAMLAAARAAGRHGTWSDKKGKPIPCQGCVLCSTLAEIERQFGLPEGSEGDGDG